MPDSNLQAPVANAQPIRQGSPEEADVQVNAGGQTVLPFNVPAPPSSSVHSSTPTRAVYPDPRATSNSLKRRFDQAISDLNNETTVAQVGAHAQLRGPTRRTRARMEAAPTDRKTRSSSKRSANPTVATNIASTSVVKKRRSLRLCQKAHVDVHPPTIGTQPRRKVLRTRPRYPA